MLEALGTLSDLLSADFFISCFSFFFSFLHSVEISETSSQCVKNKHTFPKNNWASMSSPPEPCYSRVHCFCEQKCSLPPLPLLSSPPPLCSHRNQAVQTFVGGSPRKSMRIFWMKSKSLVRMNISVCKMFHRWAWFKFKSLLIAPQGEKEGTDKPEQKITNILAPVLQCIKLTSSKMAF